MINLKRIMVATDFSEYSESALRYGCEIAEKFGAEILLLHVVEPLPATYVEGAYFSPESVLEQLENSKNRLATLPNPEMAGNISIECQTIHGNPAKQIVDTAKSEDIDLIVMGTHGRSGIAHFVMGSVAERVVQTAKIPVLTVYLHGHDFVTAETSSESVCSLV